MRPPMLVDLSAERAELRDQFHLAQRAHREAIIGMGRVLKDMALSREVMAHADLVLTWQELPEAEPPKNY